MRVFLDTNVLLDVLGRRHPHCLASAEVWSRVEEGALQGYVSAISFNNAYYVLRRIENRKAARDGLKLLRNLFRIVPLTERIVHRALDSEMSDFEDAIQFFSAHHARADFIVTRNVRDFPAEPIAVVTPEEFLRTETA